ncbi:unnamed protein product, partial [Anisakis simplex]|uniref:AMP-binding domain-containing protein n=1 Tax=Anisakis simplex TaxID=6269 RepID=A0A0M3KGN8_ANISI
MCFQDQLFFQVRFLFLSPMVLKQLCGAVSNSNRQLTHLKTIAIGTAAPDDVLMKLAYKCLPSVKSYCSVYGMTEVGTICRSTKSSSYNIHSCGSLCANLSMKSLLNDGVINTAVFQIIDLLCSEEVGPFERGLMLIKGPSVNSPYWNNEQATNEDFKYGGWRNTGDLGYYDRNGNVFLVDRVKQMIKVDGYQVSVKYLLTMNCQRRCR